MESTAKKTTFIMNMCFFSPNLLISTILFHHPPPFPPIALFRFRNEPIQLSYRLAYWLIWPHNGRVLENTQFELIKNLPLFLKCYRKFLNIDQSIRPSVLPSIRPSVRQSVSLSVGICYPFLNRPRVRVCFTLSKKRYFKRTKNQV